MNDSIRIRKVPKANALPPVNISESKTDNKAWYFLNREIRLRQGLSNKAKASFYLELALMRKAGVDIRSALELIHNEAPKGRQGTFRFILDKVVMGATLSQALKEANHFSPYEYYTLQIGEETGRLPEVLNELSLFFQRRIKQRRQIVGALAYPVMVLLVSFAAIFFMVSYVVPMFSDMFKRSGDELPDITRFVLRLSTFSKAYGGISILFLIGSLSFLYWQRQAFWLRKWSSRLLFRLPVWGALAHKIYLAQFSHTMAMLLNSKVSLVQSIQLCRRIMKLHAFEQALLQVEADITLGQSLHQALQKQSLFPPKLVAMIRVGEEVNGLDYFFKEFSEQYGNEVEHQSALLSKFIEPLTIIVLGVIVGVILIAMYLPLFKMGQQF